MTTRIKTGPNEILNGLTPGGLGRLAAVLGANANDNPYPENSPQFVAWQKGFYEVIKLQSVDYLARHQASNDSRPLSA